MGNQKSCEGVILVVGGILFLLESLQLIQIGIGPYLPIMFILLGIFLLMPKCLCDMDLGKKK